MTKKKIKYVCFECKHSSLQWLGKCPSCNSWNSFQEESSSKTETSSTTAEPKRLTDIKSIRYERIETGLSELDKVLGGGFVVGSLTLLGGEPGVGKSTLLMQVCGRLTHLNRNKKLLYISGEETESQVFLRCTRLGIQNENIFILNETNLEDILLIVKKIKPAFLIIDSIQTTISSEIKSSAGSISQVKEVTFEIMNLSKSMDITTIVIGHVTKDGSLAGPKILEHMVDTVINLEINTINETRILRSSKNRYGGTREIGLFKMSSTGIIELDYIRQNKKTVGFGNAWSFISEGSRLIMIEVQSLVVENKHSSIKRVCQGVEISRLNILIAIIEKHLKISLSNFDIFLNISEGITTKSTSIDLCVIASILSSYFSASIKENYLLIGEVGLTGEVLEARNLEDFVPQLTKQGVNNILCSNKKRSKKINIHNIITINDLIQKVFHKKLAA